MKPVYTAKKAIGGPGESHPAAMIHATLVSFANGIEPMMDFNVQHITGGPPTRTFLDGSEYWLIQLPSVRMGLGHFKPGWRWSQHAGAQTGRASSRHVGYIQSGAMMVRTADGHEKALGPGDAFEVGPNHDAWVVGAKICVALDVAFID